MNTRIKLKSSAVMLIAVGAVLLCSVPAHAWTVPDTGQTKCYNNNSEIPCPAPGEDFYGQDAQYGPNLHSYTKLDNNGNNLPDNAVDWAMVRDNVNGLIWEIKHNKDDVTHYDNPNDADNVYSWYDGSTGVPGPDNDTLDFINDLNTQKYGSYNDWRMPTAKELASLRDYSLYNPSIDIFFFPNTQAGYYWSSTIYVFTPSNSWSISFVYEDVDYYSDHLKGQFVRAVRGPQSESGTHFIDNGDGTVSDTATGLMWQQATAPDNYTWEQALQYCANLNLAGYNDWRLPNTNEQQSLVDYSCIFPAINTTYFPDTQNGIYSAATTEADYLGGFWSVNFGIG